MTIAHDFSFDPTHGFDLDALTAVQAPPGPQDFDAFWQARYDRARLLDPDPRIWPTGNKGRWLVSEVSYTSSDGFEIRGWLLTPRNGEAQRGLIVTHGYGGRDQPDFDLPVENAAVLFPCLRGISLSRSPSIPDAPQAHVLHGIDDRDKYVVGGCVEDVWLAVSALLAIFPDLENRVGYSGVSFGGGVGALAIAFETRIARGQLAVPTFGAMPLWLRLPSIGSAAGPQLLQKRGGRPIETLQYFDAATAALRIRQPMLVAPARFDPAVAPPCQFAVANALPISTYNHSFVLDAGHFDYATAKVQHEQLANRAKHFFDAL